jgi:Tfp pilus assembly protein PilX
MTRRRGFALAVVLAALVLMAMSLAVAAQRAILANHRAALAEADAEVTAVVAGAQADIGATPVDALPDTAWSPGSLLASGTARAGLAVASWHVTRISSSLALAELTAERHTAGAVARTRQSALMTIVAESAGGVWLRVLTPGGWVVRPSQ